VLPTKLVDGRACWPHLRRSTRRGCAHIYNTTVDRDFLTPLLRALVDLLYSLGLPILGVLELCSSSQDFNWQSASRGPSATAELLVGDSICLLLHLDSLKQRTGMFRYRSLAISTGLCVWRSMRRLAGVINEAVRRAICDWRTAIAWRSLTPDAGTAVDGFLRTHWLWRHDRKRDISRDNIQLRKWIDGSSQLTHRPTCWY